MFRMIIVALILGVASQAKAQQSPLIIYGAGHLPCADFLNASRNIPFGQFESRKGGAQEMLSANAYFLGYAAGYLNAYNIFVSNAVNNLSMSSLDAELRNYCSANPSKMFVDAVFSTVGKLVPK